MSLSYLVKVNNRFRMDADELQARSVALEELCKQPEKDSPHLLVLKKKTHRQTNLIKQLCHKCSMINHFCNSLVLFVFRVMRYVS